MTWASFQSQPDMATLGNVNGVTGLHDFDLLVIGSGPGGQKAAIAAAKLDRRVAVVERPRMLGGGSRFRIRGSVGRTTVPW